MKLCQQCGLVTGGRVPVCPEDGGPLAPLLPGPPLIDERYRLLRCLGRGGMGLVFLAEHLVLKRQVAIKIVRPDRLHDERAKARFRTEAEALGRLEHPAVVTVIDYGIDERAGSLPYLVMELLDGPTLAERLAEHGPIALTKALPLLEQLAAALDAAHTSGVLHRDLKPGNVALIDAGQGLEAKLLDLGIARILDEELQGSAQALPPAAGDQSSGTPTITQADQTRPGTFVGTPAYAAPEMLAGDEPTAAADLFSFAVVVYETLTGVHPFVSLEKSPQQVERARPRPPSAINPAVPRQIDAPVLSGLCADPDARPGSASALVAALRQAEEQRRERHARARLRARRRYLAPAVALIATLAAVTTGHLPPMQWLDRQLLDLGFSLSTPRSASDRLLLVTIDDETLATGHTSLAGLGQEAGVLLARLLEGGATAIGIDLLLPRQWSEQPAFARVLIGHSERIVLGLSGDAGRLVGPEVVSGLVTAALGQQRAGELLGVVDLDLDPDGVTRRFRTVVPATDQGQRPTFAARLAGMADRPGIDDTRAYLIDFRVDIETIRRIPWHRLSSELERQPRLAQNRVVIVGATFSGAGDVFRRLPGSGFEPRRMNGIELQALVLHTLLSPCPARLGAPYLAAGLALLGALTVVWIVLGPSAIGPRSVLAGMICLGLGSMATVVFVAYGVWTGAAVPLLAGLCTGGLATGIRVLMPMRGMDGT